MSAGQSLSPLDSATSGTNAAAGSSGNSSSSNSSAGSATISANDFLELLVTEMQNQDPTNATDPNEYINQLVNVNSLEQLININQTLTGAFGSTSSGASSSGASSSGATGDAASASSPNASPAASALTAAPLATRSVAAHPLSGASSQTGAPAAIASAHRVSGNLSSPAANPAAQRVAHALDGHPRARPLSGKLAGAEPTSRINRP
jgi:flagellar basal-body rod modification protein FlgD